MILTPRQQKVLEMRWLDGKTYKEIAEEFDVTITRIRYIERKSIQTIKPELEKAISAE